MQIFDELMQAPGVQVLLDAIDQRLNSNTLLLAHRVPADLADAGVSQALATLLHQPAFWTSLLLADRLRGGCMGWDGALGARPGALLPPGARLELTALAPAELQARLAWMLAVGGDWYGLSPRLNEQEVRERIDGFEQALTRYATSWSWAQARPNFLHSSGYFDYQADGPEAGAVTYFDGGSCDGALAGLGGDVLVLLLSNGSP